MFSSSLISCQVIQIYKQCKLSLALECMSAKMLFKFSHLIKLMVSWSSVKSGLRLRMYHQFDWLFAIRYLRWVCGAYATKKQLLIWMSPLSHQFHQIIISKYHFKIVWLSPVLVLIWGTIFVEPFLSFLCIFGSYWHIIVVSNSEIANLLLCPVYSLWGQIVLFDLSYCYNLCHISFCHSKNVYIFWYIQYTKITIIIKTTETHILKCVPPSHFGGR